MVDYKIIMKLVTYLNVRSRVNVCTLVAVLATDNNRASVTS